MQFKLFRVSAMLGVLVLGACPCFAQQPPEAAAIRAEITRLRQQLDALEARLAALEGGAAAAAPGFVARQGWRVRVGLGRCDT